MFLHLFRKIKEEGLDKQEFIEILQNRNKLKELRNTFNIIEAINCKPENQILNKKIIILKKRDKILGINSI